MSSIRLKCLLAAFSLLFCTSSLASATSPAEFVTKSKGDFDGCELNGVTLTDEGKITLSPKLEVIKELNASQVWAVAVDNSGTVYAGTGDDGKLFALRSGAEPQVLYDSDEQQLHSVLVDSRGRLYVGTGPTGLVLKVDPKSGDATKLFETKEKYVWSLAAGPGGEIYAGTGPSGKVFKISSAGKGEVIFEPPAQNITALYYDVDRKRLLVGASSGIVYSLVESEKPRSHLEVSGMEIRTILVDRGEMFVLAMGNGGPIMARPSGGDGGGAAPPEGALQAALAAAMGGDKPPAIEPPPAPKGPTKAGKAKSGVYRVFEDGHFEELFRTDEGFLFCMDWHKQNLLLFGYRNSEGVVVRLSKDGEADLFRAIEDAKFVSAGRAFDGSFALGTSEVAKVFRLWPDKLEQEGSVVSEVADAGSRAAWGNVNWKAEVPSRTEVEVFTRSGEVSSVDGSWDDWRGPLKEAAGSQCQSPKARYIQFKAVLSSKKEGLSPSLDELTIPYIQLNLAPEVDQITIHDPGKDPSSVIRAAKSKGASGRYENLKCLEKFSEMGDTKTLRAITWQASDPNDDDLLYSAYLRAAGAEWRLLTKDTEMNFYVIDTSLLDDGEYFCKVVACDGPSNSGQENLCGEEESDEFVVDNTPPVIEIKRAKKRPDGSFEVSGIISDETSRLSAAWCAFDMGDFEVMRPSDGIFDTREEKFEITTPAMDGAKHYVTIRAEDAAGNIRVARKELSR